METTAANREHTKKINTISHALSILNEAADDSAEEIRGMVRTDFQHLKQILADVKPELKEAIGELKKVTSDSVNRAKEKVVTTAKSVDNSVHRNAWTYLGGVAAASAVLGFLMGRKVNGECKRGDSNASLN